MYCYIRIWCVDLTAGAGADTDVVTRWLPLLSEDERARLQRLRHARDACRYVVSHAALRDLLAKELGVAAQELVITHGATGKPRLAAPYTDLHFNLSHSEELAIVAISNLEVGVDVEYHQPLPDVASLLPTTCHADEYALLQGADPMLPLFYRLWVAKEAVLKCLGRGLQLPSNEFAVLDAQGQLQATPRLPAAWQFDSTIHLRCLSSLPDHYSGAIAWSHPLNALSATPDITVESWRA